MGTTESRNGANSSRIKMNRNYFEFRYVIGRGGFSKVWKVIFKKTQKLYALKEMLKVKIIDCKSEISIRTERDSLSRLHHPFIVNMIYAFQDYENLYLVIDLLMGGDLRYHLCRNIVFSEEQTKFFIACLILGLEYIHSNNIIHRDIKPENLVLDGNGYIRITDFGVSKIMSPNNSSETSGTPGYMAPEVLCGQNHSFTVDFFAIGVMGYEFIFGERPYLGNNRREIKQAVLSRQALITYEELPQGWSKESADFLNELLIRNPHKRLGSTNGIEALKIHHWFNNFNWNDLKNKTMLSPFVSKSLCNFDQSYCEAVDPIESETIKRYHKIMERDDFNHLFNGYTYINEQEANSFMFQSNRQKLIQQITFGTVDNNMQFNKTSRLNKMMQFQSKLKPSLIKTKAGLLLNSKLLSSSSSPRMINLAHLRPKLKPKAKVKQSNESNGPKVNSRNLSQCLKNSSVIRRHDLNSNLDILSCSSLNQQYRTMFKSNSNFDLSKNSNANSKRNDKRSSPLIKKIENSFSCKDIGALLPTLKSNYAKIGPGKDLNDIYNSNKNMDSNNKYNRVRNKIILPISISSNYRSMSLIKSMSFSMTNSFLKHKLSNKR